MKVLHLSTSDRGGAGIAGSRLHQAMLEKGIESHFLTLYHRDETIAAHPVYQPEKGWVVPMFLRIYYFIRKALDHSGLFLLPHRRIAKKQLKGHPHGFENFSFCFSIYDIKQHPLFKEAEIIHLHWITEGFIDFNSFFKGINKKVVWTLHDMNPFTGGCHQSDDCDGYKFSCNNCPQLANTINTEFAAVMLSQKNEVLQRLNSGSVKIVSPSKWLSDISASSSLFKKFEHSVIPNAHSENVFRIYSKAESRKMLGINSDKKVILFISHSISHARKGISFLKNVMSKLKVDDVLFVSVGADNTESVNDIQTVNLGYITDEEQMSRIYSASDIFVLPSIAENYPNTICEALLCGVPVVAFNVGGNPELINRNNGILVELRNEEELINAINKILNNSEFYIAENIREEAIQKFSAGNSVKKYLDIYNSFR